MSGVRIAWHRTPASVHYGPAEQVRQQQAVTLDAAFQSHPERFVSKPPTPPRIPEPHPRPVSTGLTAAPRNRIAPCRKESTHQKCQGLAVVESDHRGHRNLPKTGQRHILQTFGVGLRVGG